MSRRLDSARGRDQGETLIELLIAVAIIAITAAALIGTVLTSITSSGSHRVLTNNDTYVRSFANAAAQQIQRQKHPLYEADATATTYAIVAPSDLPASYVIGITGIKYWSGTGWVDNFPGGNPAQLITVGVQSPTQVTTSVSFAVRNPNDLG